ncbi:FecR family protein [Mucilaginibacter sp. NFR10]|uniref:FecR family protein n=1 Tax=Mucilaginibacter sp. NFR10 TaxID=1566292 RepID=UPI00087198D7|nr:FecR domain-containing protein [Mucilaginibacter sp. NFR10]SCW53794.1 FecR family protein [Mucilaginibacter sp. NFR10]
MAKFPFRKKQSGANDRHLQEELVNKYFDELDLRSVQNEAGDDVEFNADGLYSRINATLDNAEKKTPGKSKRWMVAASLLAGLCITVTAAYHYRYALLDRLDPIASKQLVAANGQTINFTLADGTKIWLNAGSKLTYPETFRGEKREIKLEGEAFLDVAHDPAKAFIIHTGQVSTHVLGTSFNIKAYANESFIKVDVLSGKVGVVTPAGAAKNTTTFLTPAEEVVFNKDGLSVTKNKQVDVNALSSWKDGELVFKNMALPEVLNTINRHFNVTVKADVNLARCSITANFTNVSLENIMKIISKLVKGKAVQKGPAYQLKGKGC